LQELHLVLAYGSGSKSKGFEGTIQQDWQCFSKHKSVSDFEKSNPIDFITYEKLHKGTKQ
jgi:hydroxymethylglutaryl-CoA synthase